MGTVEPKFRMRSTKSNPDINGSWKSVSTKSNLSGVSWNNSQAFFPSSASSTVYPSPQTYWFGREELIEHPTPYIQRNPSAVVGDPKAHVAPRRDRPRDGSLRTVETDRFPLERDFSVAVEIVADGVSGVRGNIQNDFVQLAGVGEDWYFRCRWHLDDFDGGR